MSVTVELEPWQAKIRVRRRLVGWTATVEACGPEGEDVVPIYGRSTAWRPTRASAVGAAERRVDRLRTRHTRAEVERLLGYLPIVGSRTTDGQETT